MDQADHTPNSNGNVTAPGRKMSKAELMGRHTHSTRTGVHVHIYQRDGKFLARGRLHRRAFGQTLGADTSDAESQLRHLLVEIEKGTFLRPSEMRSRPLKNGPAPECSLRQLCDAFLVERRKLRGKKTVRTYQMRLHSALDFAEQQNSMRKWRFAAEIDRDFVISLREYLMNRTTTRNGRPGASLKPLSSRHIRNCLEMLRGVLAWGLQADVRKLPPEFVNPVTSEIIGPKPIKDPLRKVLLPMVRRMELLENMDRWQFQTLAILLVLPFRFEDIAGMLISDVDFSERVLHLRTRFGGGDFNKGRVDVQMPLPEALIPMLIACRGERQEGPLFISRAVFGGRQRIGQVVHSRDELEQQFYQRLQRGGRQTVQTEQDRKECFRTMLNKEFGGVATGRIGKELRTVFRQTGITDGVRPYDLRGAVTTDMKSSGMGHLELRYLTGHSTNDILNEYTSLSPVSEMQRYFQHIQLLLETLSSRAESLGKISTP